MEDNSLESSTARCREVERVARMCPLSIVNEFDRRLNEILRIAQEVDATLSSIETCISFSCSQDLVDTSEHSSKDTDPQATETLNQLCDAYRNGDLETTWQLSQRLLDDLALGSPGPAFDGSLLISSVTLRRAALEEWLLFVVAVTDEFLRPTPSEDVA